MVKPFRSPKPLEFIMAEKHKGILVIRRTVYRADIALLSSVVLYLLAYKLLRILTSADNMIAPSVYVLAAVPASALLGWILCSRYALLRRFVGTLIVVVSVTILGLSVGSIFTESGQTGLSYLLGLAVGVLSVYAFWLNNLQKDDLIGRLKLHRIVTGVLLLSTAVFTLVASLWFNRFTLNLDGISYLSIADHYANGYYKDAVNAYWSPMISWLMVPLIWVGIPAAYAFRILLGLSILGVLFVQYKIQKSLLKDSLSSWIALGVSFLALVTMGAFGPVTPDIFVVLWVMVYALVLTRNLSQSIPSYRFFVLVGFLAAVGFYTKGFLLPLFVISFAAYGLYFWWNSRSRLAVQKVAISYLVLALLILPWLALLNLKYERWMLGSANSYNMSWIGPHSTGHPNADGPLPPANNHAVSAWEDPTDHPYVKWSPLDSIEDAQYHVVHNIPRTLSDVGWTVFRWSPIMATVLISGFLILWLASSPKRVWHDNRVRFIVAANSISLIYLLGYVAVHLVGGQRYILSVVFLLIPSLLALVSYVADIRYMKPRSSGVYYMAWFLAVWFTVINVTAPNVELSVEGSDRAQQLAFQADDLKTAIPEGSSLVSNALSESYTTAYLVGAQSYGVIPQANYVDPTTRDALTSYDIDYFLCVSGNSSDCGFGFTEPIWQGNIDKGVTMRVYKIE